MTNQGVGKAGWNGSWRLESGARLVGPRRGKCRKARSGRQSTDCRLVQLLSRDRCNSLTVRCSSSDERYYSWHSFLVLFVPKEDRGRAHHGYARFVGDEGKSAFLLKRVSIQPRAQCFSGDTNEAGKDGFHKEEFNGRTGWLRRSIAHLKLSG